MLERFLCWALGHREGPREKVRDDPVVLRTHGVDGVVRERTALAATYEVPCLRCRGMIRDEVVFLGDEALRFVDPQLDEVLAAVDEVGVDVSVDWRRRGTEVKPKVEGGSIVSVALVPEVVTAKICFRVRGSAGIDGLWVELEVSGATPESCRDAALMTLRAHRSLLVPGTHYVESTT